MTKIFVDSDIIIDVLAKRTEYLAGVRLLTIVRQQRVSAYTTPIVLANVDYLITKFANRRKSRKSIHTLRKYLGILMIDESIVDVALDSDFPDFEDAIQYFAAEAASLDFIVTRNKRDYEQGKIRVVDAQEFVDLHNAGRNMEV